MKEGFFMVKRETSKRVFALNDSYCCSIFFWIAAHVNWKDSSDVLPKQGFKVRKNQMATSFRQIHLSLGISINKVKACLKKLELHGIIKIYTSNYGTVISLIQDQVEVLTPEEIKYEILESRVLACHQETRGVSPGDTPPVTRRHASYHPVPTSEEVIINKEEERDGLALFNETEIQKYSIEKVIDLCRQVFRETKAILNGKSIDQYPSSIAYDDISYRRAIDMLDKAKLPRAELLKAIYGARFELPSDKFNPAKHFNPKRFEKRENIQNFISRYDDYIAKTQSLEPIKTQVL